MQLTDYFFDNIIKKSYVLIKRIFLMPEVDIRLNDDILYNLGDCSILISRGPNFDYLAIGDHFSSNGSDLWMTYIHRNTAISRPIDMNEFNLLRLIRNKIIEYERSLQGNKFLCLLNLRTLKHAYFPLEYHEKVFNLTTETVEDLVFDRHYIWKVQKLSLSISSIKGHI